MVPERTSVRVIVNALGRSSARHCHVDGFSTLISFHDAGFHCLAFFYAHLELLRVVPSDVPSAVNEVVLARVVGIGETLIVVHVKSFDGSPHWLISRLSELLAQLSELLLQHLHLFLRLVLHQEPVDLLGVRHFV